MSDPKAGPCCMKDIFDLVAGPRIDFLCQVPELTVAPHPALTSHISGIFNFLAQLKFFDFSFKTREKRKKEQHEKERQANIQVDKFCKLKIGMPI